MVAHRPVSDIRMSSNRDMNMIWPLNLLMRDSVLTPCPLEIVRTRGLHAHVQSARVHTSAVESTSLRGTKSQSATPSQKPPEPSRFRGLSGPSAPFVAQVASWAHLGRKTGVSTKATAIHKHVFDGTESQTCSRTAPVDWETCASGFVAVPRGYTGD